MRRTATLICLLALAAAAPAQGEWAKGVPFTTSWDEAIKAVSESGKLLFIYNGWENKGI